MKHFFSPYRAHAFQQLERDARRLRAEHAGDPLTRLVLAVDLQMRRAAHHVASRLMPAAR
jgi:hypothetical protein